MTGSTLLRLSRAITIASVIALFSIFLGSGNPERGTGTVNAGLDALDVEGESEVHVVNLGTEADDANVSLTALDGGTPVESLIGPIAPLSSAAIQLASIASLESGSPYSASGDDGSAGPFGMVARTRWDGPNASSTYNAPPVGTALVVPFAAKFDRGQSTFLSIQNTDSDNAASVQIVAIKSATATPTMTGTLEIAAGASAGFWLGDEASATADLRDGWSGTLWIRSDREISAHAWVSDENDGPSVYDTVGLRPEDGAPEWHVARFRAQREVDDAAGGVAASRIAVVNPSNRIAVLVTAEMRGEAGVCAGETYVSATKTVRAGSNVIFDFGSSPSRFVYDVEVPDDCEGTVFFHTSVGEVLVWVVEERWSPDLKSVIAAGAYSARSNLAAANREIAPVYSEGSAGVMSIRGMNLGSEPAELRLTLRGDGIDGAACGSPCTAMVAPGASHVWNRSDLPGFPAEGLAAVELSSDQPVTMLLDDIPYSVVSDLSLYSGIPLTDSGPTSQQNLPILLNGARLSPPARDPTPTATNTFTPMPTRIPPVLGTPTGTPSPIPSRTPSPTPTIVPTEVPLGDVWIQSLVEGAESVAELRLIAEDGSTAVSRMTRALGFGASARIPLDPLAAVLGEVVHGGIALRGTALGALASLRAFRGAAVAYVPPETGLEIIVPMAVIDYDGQWSSVAIQNTSDAPVEVRVELWRDGDIRWSRAPRSSIPAGGSISYRLGVDTEFVAVPVPTPAPGEPSGFRGWLRVTSDGPVGVVSTIEELDSARTVHSVAGIPLLNASSLNVAPAVHSTDSLSSTLTLFNPGESPVDASIAYRGIGGSCIGDTFDSGSLSIDPRSGVDAGPGSGDGVLPADCVANATITSDAPILVAVASRVEDTSGADRFAGAAGYDAVPRDLLGFKLGLPRLRSAADGMSSRIYVMNAGDTESLAQLTVFDPEGLEIAGCGSACDLVIGAGDGGVWDLTEIDEIPEGFSGSAIVSGNSILAAVVIDRPDAPGRDLEAYKGQPLERSAPPRHLPMLNFTIKPGFVVEPTATASPWPTSTPRPTSYPSTGAHDLIGMQNLNESAIASFVIVNLLPESSSDGLTSVIRVGGPPGAAHRMDSRLESFGPLPRAGTFNSDQAIGLVGRHVYPDGAVTSQNAGQNGTDVIVPWVVDQPGGPSSLVTIEAGSGGIFIPGLPGGLAGDAEVELFTMGSSEPVASTKISVPGNTYRRFDLGVAFPDTDLPRDEDGRFAGWMRVRSVSPIAVQTTIGSSPTSPARYSVAGQPAELGSPNLWAPLVRNAMDGNSSEIMVFNPGEAPVDVAVSYAGHGGRCAGERFEHEEGTITIAPFDSAVFSQKRPLSGLPLRCEASATVDATGGPIMALALDENYYGGLAAYELFTRFEVGQRIALPLLYSNDEGRSTRIYASSTDLVAEPQTVTLRLWDLFGIEVDCEACEAVLEPGESVLWDTATLEGVPDGFAGSGEIQSKTGVIAVVEDAALSGKGDGSLWRGIRAEIAAPGIYPLPITVSGEAAKPTPGPSPTPAPKFYEVDLPYSVVAR